MSNISTASDNTETRASLICAAAFVVLILALTAYMLAPPKVLLDLSEFYTAPSMILNGKGGDIYTPGILLVTEKALFPGQQEVVFYLPPCGLAWLLPLAFFPLSFVHEIWWATLIACVAASLVLLKFVFDIKEKSMVRLAAFACALGAEWETIKHGQIAALLLLALCLFAYYAKKNQPVLSGLALSVFAMKPQLAFPLVVYFLGARLYRPLVFAAVFTTILWLLALPMIGMHGFDQYFHLPFYALNRHWMAPEAGPTIRGQLLRFFPQNDSPVAIASSACLILALIALFLLGRKYAKSDYRLHFGLILLPIGLVTTLHMHGYDVLLLLPGFVAVLALTAAHGGWNWRKGLILGALTIIFVMPFYNKIQYEYLLAGGLVNPFVIMLICISGAAIVYCNHIDRLESSQASDA